MTTKITTPTFRLWRQRLGLSQRQAAQELGVSLDWVKTLDAGRRRGAERSVRVPLNRRTRLAMAAVEAGLEPA